MEKTIEQIMADIAKDNEFKTFEGLMWAYTDHEEHVKPLISLTRNVATRYASQFQTNNDLITTEICVLRERVAELEEHMKECASVLSWVLDNARPDSDWQTFTNSVMNAMIEAESLINKGKDNEEI